MTDEPTQAIPRQPEPGLPAHGSVGPADPHADPVTQPALWPLRRSDAPIVHPRGLPVPGPAPAHGSRPGPDPTPAPAPHTPGSTRPRTGGIWVGLVLSAVVLLFLLIFILQNGEPVRITFLGGSGTLPTGVALLFAAVAGLLLVAIPAGLRILQLRRAAQRTSSPPR